MTDSTIEQSIRKTGYAVLIWAVLLCAIWLLTWGTTLGNFQKISMQEFSKVTSYLTAEQTSNLERAVQVQGKLWHVVYGIRTGVYALFMTGVFAMAKLKSWGGKTAVFFGVFGIFVDGAIGLLALLALLNGVVTAVGFFSWKGLVSWIGAVISIMLVYRLTRPDIKDYFARQVRPKESAA